MKIYFLNHIETRKGLNESRQKKFETARWMRYEKK